MLVITLAASVLCAARHGPIGLGSQLNLSLRKYWSHQLRRTLLPYPR